MQGPVPAGQQGAEFFLNDGEKLSCGGPTLGHLFSSGPFPNRLQKSFHHAEVNIGLEQGTAHLPESLGKGPLVEPPLAPHPAEQFLETCGECVEHDDP